MAKARCSISVAALAVFLTLATSASAAQVSVLEAPGKYGEMEAVLLFRASPGENDHLTIRTVGKVGEMLQLRLLDGGAAIAPGPGCRRDGRIGALVNCELHQPLRPQGEGPGTWDVGISIDLGDGDNYFDGSSFTGPQEGLEMFVTSGAGDDVLATGGGDDFIEPGAGHDLVKGGAGYDIDQSAAGPDGSDRYDLGRGGGTVDYSYRRTPVLLRNGRAGARGEHDSIAGSGDISVIGGEAADHLVAGGALDHLEGTSGNDVLIGGPESDRLEGDAGTDTLVGRGGNDEIDGGIDGNDLVYGGSGNDKVEAGEGASRIYGGTGEDRISGGEGSDLLAGGPGRDLLVGGDGIDHLFGGDGADRLFSDRKSFYLEQDPRDPLDGRDVDDCGLGHDFVTANPWDRRNGCEVVEIAKDRTRATRDRR
jgi:Ca2+-binding RTX toxin-like protein